MMSAAIISLGMVMRKCRIRHGEERADLAAQTCRRSNVRRCLGRTEMNGYQIEHTIVIPHGFTLSVFALVIVAVLIWLYKRRAK
jgi:hypothetical protein